MFAERKILEDHFERHGRRMGYPTADAYLQGALLLMDADEGILHFVRYDGATLYYRASTNEFAALAANGVILTYFEPREKLGYWLEQTRGGGNESSY